MTININVPANDSVSYSCVRWKGGASYINESQNRTVTTGGCGSSQTVHDNITTAFAPTSVMTLLSGLPLPFRASRRGRQCKAL